MRVRKCMKVNGYQIPDFRLNFGGRLIGEYIRVYTEYTQSIHSCVELHYKDNLEKYEVRSKWFLIQVVCESRLTDQQNLIQRPTTVNSTFFVAPLYISAVCAYFTSFFLPFHFYGMSSLYKDTIVRFYWANISWYHLKCSSWCRTDQGRDDIGHFLVKWTNCPLEEKITLGKGN